MILDVNLLQVRKYVMEEVNKAGKAKKLRGFEMIKSVLLDEEAWAGTQASFFISHTTTMKLHQDQGVVTQNCF